MTLGAITSSLNDPLGLVDAMTLRRPADTETKTRLHEDMVVTMIWCLMLVDHMATGGSAAGAVTDLKTERVVEGVLSRLAGIVTTPEGATAEREDDNIVFVCVVQGRW